ncbi:MAG: glutamate synthase large subunit [Pseudomonadota bacterium]|nr:glutamate synthase large subunit [Pseudomonadota bacterium]
MGNQNTDINRFINRYPEEAERLSRDAVINVVERDACGVGLVAAIDGKASRQVVEAGIEALKALWHRGAVDADGMTGDGAGILVEIPQDFFRDHVGRTGHTASDGPIAVGMTFLPRTDLEAQERCRFIAESEILKFGYPIYGWRQVPINLSALGEKASATRPEIEQIMIEGTANADMEKLERDLFIIRKRIENRARQENIQDFYICSLSCRSLIYKGMFLAEQLSAFYPDLLDQRFVSRFALYHQRYSTNTFPTWRLAQPFRMLAHNGEINTLSGNVNWMRSHETRLQSEIFGKYIDDVKPIIEPGNSDSASLDNAFEILVRNGRSAPMVKCLMIPDAWSQKPTMSQELRDFYSFCNCVMEPWDGPAAITATDGRWVLGGVDRNGLRPMRYTVTADGLLVVGSETGMVPIRETEIIEKGRLGPGQMIAVDLKEGKLYHDTELKNSLARSKPYGEWVANVKPIEQIGLTKARVTPEYEMATLRRRQVAAGYTLEELELLLQPMVEDGKEAVGSMGDDTPLAVLSEQYRGLHHFFRQSFSQVTNPPIDSLREYGVMSLKTRLGNLGNILEENGTGTNLLQLNSPVLFNAEFAAMSDYMGKSAVELDCTFRPQKGEHALRRAIYKIQRVAEDAVRGGATHLILSDHKVSANRAAIPMILATGAVHSHLVEQALRTYTSMNVRCAECLDTHYFAVLLGVGATTINAYLAQETIRDRHRRNLFGDISIADCLKQYRNAVDQGLLKIMSKMGISILSSYRGAYKFEAVGLSRWLVSSYFPGMTSRISGIGLTGLQRKIGELHARAFSHDSTALPVGGIYRYRRSGENHGFEGSQIHTLQKSVSTESFATYKQYSEAVRESPPISLRDLMEFESKRQVVAIEEVESITEIRKRLVSPGISLGALSPEAHETLSIAMNRIGAKSDSGEGGEDSSRYKPRANGDNASSAIKQVASGRFGVTAEYLNNCREIEIKIAQGAKPGEGGQLPGIKVSEVIAKLRHSTPGVTLISPPPHHDIYSIEDLAQLIYDLKQINPDAKVCVKLVAQTGIGTIAAGVAKAHADTILVSGHSGGTGASPQSSIKYAGLPWEMGLSEVHQVLTLNQLRHRVVIRTDGGFRTGRDVVIAALLGAEEFGIGTASLIAMGCIMVRQCHSNTCPVGVCTQQDILRDKFTGTPEKVVNLFSFIAEEVREILASLGARSLKEIIGHTEFLTQVSRGSPHLDDLDLNPLLIQADPGDAAHYCTIEGRNEVPETLDAQMIEDASPALEGGEKMQLQYNVRNTQRAIGTKLSSLITRRFGMKGLQPGHITVRLRGSAGQSLGAFAVQGLKLEVFGDANDYVGKGLSGGTIVIRPPTAAPRKSNEHTIIGNTALYGATGGKVFAAGQAGERFAVRNSGAEVVVEGCGSNGCEYMTNGIAVILGPVGDNFGAGMTGGMVYVYDHDGSLLDHLNKDTLMCHRIQTSFWEKVLKRAVEEHHRETQSAFAEQMLNHWSTELQKFWQVVPKEMVHRYEQSIFTEEAELIA